jgi:hypothetical protein
VAADLKFRVAVVDVEAVLKPAVVFKSDFEMV